MGTGPRLLRAAKLGFGKWLQRRTERGEPEGRRPRGWGPSLLSFLGALWQWNRLGIARLPAEGFPGPGLRELRQRVAFLGRWLCNIVATAVAAGPRPSLAPSCQAVLFKTEAVTVIQAMPVLTVCPEKREVWRCGGREPAAVCGAGRYASRGSDRVPRVLLWRARLSLGPAESRPAKDTWAGA